jgi:hypothetical protein
MLRFAPLVFRIALPALRSVLRIPCRKLLMGILREFGCARAVLRCCSEGVSFNSELAPSNAVAEWVRVFCCKGNLTLRCSERRTDKGIQSYINNHKQCMYLPDKGIQREYSKDPYQAPIYLYTQFLLKCHVTYHKSGQVRQVRRRLNKSERELLDFTGVGPETGRGLGGRSGGGGRSQSQTWKWGVPLQWMSEIGGIAQAA